MRLITEFSPGTKHISNSKLTHWVSRFTTLVVVALLLVFLAENVAPFIDSTPIPTDQSIEESHTMNSIIAWVGGKRLLRKEILKRLPQHDTFVEVFGGAGWVLFGKDPDPKKWAISRKSSRYQEVFNDINGDLINFWTYIQQHPQAFVAELERYIASREIFIRFLQGKPQTELERAVSFYYRVACSFGSMGTTFAGKGSPDPLPLRKLDKVLKASQGLRNVVIENQDFKQLIRHYNKPSTVFYCDPPYYELESFYDRDDAEHFTAHDELCERLKTVKGKWLLSYNDHPTIREMYKDFRIEELKTTYSLSGKQKEKTELLISNIEG